MAKTREQELQRRRDWRQKNLEKARAAGRQWYAAHKDGHLAVGTEWRKKNAGRLRAHNRKQYLKSYGLTIQLWEAMLIAQSGRCAACCDPLDGIKEPHIDHDHATDRVRGLLCSPCNTALGHAKDSIERLMGLVHYLEAHQ